MLAALPEKELIARMGQEGKRLRQLARGELPHLFQPVEPAFTLEERMELDAPVESAGFLLFVVGVMLDQLILRAKARILALASVTITLALDGGGSHTRTVRPALPTTDKQLWIKLLHLDLEAHPPQAPSLLSRFTLSQAAPARCNSAVLSAASRKQRDWMSRLLASAPSSARRMSAALYFEDTHAPESFRMEPFTVPSGESCRSRILATASLDAAASSTGNSFRHVARTHDRRYSSFANDRYTVEHAYGPWLAERRLVESDALGMRAMGSGGASAGRLPALLLHDA